MTDEHITPYHMRLPMAKARERLAEIVMRVQDPRYYCVLSRHGKPVAAVVSMAALRRIQRQEDVSRVYDGRWAPGNWYSDGKGKLLTIEEAGETVQQVQLDRLAERRILAKSGLEPVPGGEVEMDALTETVDTAEAGAEPVAATGRKKRGWWRWGRRTSGA